LISAHSFAGSATWSVNPVSNDWNTAANWTPATVPNGPGDVATFSVSSIKNISISGNVLLSQLVFAADAVPYKIAINAPLSFTFIGPGITNSSSKKQHINLTGDSSGDGTLVFLGSSSAGSNSGTIITATGGEITYGGGGAVEFHDTSSAGGSTLIENAPVYAFEAEASITFFDQSTAGTATINVTNVPSELTFTGSSTADHATISSTSGSAVFLIGTSNAGSANITIEGNNELLLGETAYAGPNASIINNEGFIALQGKNDVPVELQSIGNFGVIQVGDAGGSKVQPSIGSLSGDGIIYLYKGSTLVVGSNNLNTEFAGYIADDPDFGGGGFSKVGTGSLTLSYPYGNGYSKGTTITSGVLLVKNTSGSATASGPVTISGGTLGGRGIISGTVTVGTGSGAGAVIAPSQGASNPTTLTLQNLLTFKADGSYLYRLNTNKATADQVIAKGVTIESGAQFNFKVVANKKLTAGTVFTAISNTATTSISGTFANLTDGSTVTLGANKLQVSYSGGDGNDLTLTVAQ